MPLHEDEIIDLTVPDEVIVIESTDDEHTANGSNAIVVGQSVSGTPNRRRNQIKRSKRKRDVEEIEDGEISSSSKSARGTGELRILGAAKPREEKGKIAEVGSKSRGVLREDRRKRNRDERRTPPSPKSLTSPVPIERKSSSSQQHPELPSGELFFVDVKPLPGFVKPITDPLPGPSTSISTASLILPAHVSVFNPGIDGIIPIEILPPEEAGSASDEDYIEYLETGDWKAPGMLRYFDEQNDVDAKPSKPTKYLCKHCGEEGAHKTYQCPVSICLTCGVRNEHETRNCPISKTCFKCGMRGHINANCPNRWNDSENFSAYDHCDRCGSDVHKTNECPTIWRLYRYHTDDEQVEALKVFERTCEIVCADGGQPYAPGDEWCYNCGDFGHLGDDCNDDWPPQSHQTREVSAFGVHSHDHGPFSDSPQKVPVSDRPPEAKFTDSLSNVGRRGKEKSREKLQRQMKDQDDEPDSWFDRRGGQNRGGPPRRNDPTPSAQPTKKSDIKFSNGSRSPSKTSLLQRMEPPSGRDRSRDESRARNYSDRHSSGYRDRDRENQRQQSGPRYRGGYSR